MIDIGDYELARNELLFVAGIVNPLKEWLADEAKHNITLADALHDLDNVSSKEYVNATIIKAIPHMMCGLLIRQSNLIDKCFDNPDKLHELIKYIYSSARMLI